MESSLYRAWLTAIAVRPPADSAAVSHGAVPTSTIMTLVIPAAVVLAVLAILLFGRFGKKAGHKRSLLITIAILILFSGDTAKRIVFYYQHLFRPDDASRSGATFPIDNVLLSLAIGILLFFFVEYVVGKFRKIPADTQDNAPTTLLNTLVISVLGLSFFLVISVFITIPYLSEISKPSVYTQQMLDSTLDRIADQQLVFTPPSVATPAFLAADTLGSGHVPPGMTQYIDEERARVNVLVAKRTNAVAGLMAFSASYKQNEAFAMQKLSRDFASASQDIRRNKPDLFGKAVDAFVLYRKKTMDAYNHAMSMLRTADVVDSAEVSIFFRELLPDSMVRDSAIGQIRQIGFAAYPDTIAEYQIPAIQASNNDGSEWGIFGLMSQYLINTESSELVLLMGMLGFGLLGASLSSFVSVENDRNIFQTFRSKPLVDNFGYVLARGGGAAIAVYLCTKAGLAIFTMGSATSSDNASSYMLLLTCFVASLYSDRVWTTLSNSLTTGTGSGSPAKTNADTTNNAPVGGKDNPPPGNAFSQTATGETMATQPETFDPNDINNEPPTDPPPYHNPDEKDPSDDPQLPHPEAGA